mmetsp:Transcript_108910/g.303674  ORF Transcript_108910/g.303674 Transcript_108910/m.303674 type:complete len:227 (-) Transcript_108910:193-873(-)
MTTGLPTSASKFMIELLGSTFKRLSVMGSWQVIMRSKPASPPTSTTCCKASSQGRVPLSYSSSCSLAALPAPPMHTFVASPLLKSHLPSLEHVNWTALPAPGVPSGQVVFTRWSSPVGFIASSMAKVIGTFLPPTVHSAMYSVAGQVGVASLVTCSRLLHSPDTHFQASVPSVSVHLKVTTSSGVPVLSPHLTSYVAPLPLYFLISKSMVMLGNSSLACILLHLSS